MTTEAKINTILIVILVLIFAALAASAGYSTTVFVLSLVFFAILMVLYIGIANPELVGKLINLVSQRKMTVSLGALLGLLLIFALYTLFMGRFHATDLLAVFLYLLAPLVLVMIHRREENVLSVWLALAILAIWLPIEFGILPNVKIPLERGVAVPTILGLIWAMYLFLVLRRLDGVGLTYKLHRQDWKTAIVYFAVFTVLFAVPIGIPLKFISSTQHMKPVQEWVVTAIVIMFFTGVPEEFLFRGLIHNLIQRTMPGKHRVWISLAISSVIFGFAHSNNHVAPQIDIWLPVIGDFSFPWVYVLLASIAGWFYGLTYIKTGKVTAAALVHCFVDTWWSLFLNG